MSGAQVSMRQAIIPRHMTDKVLYSAVFIHDSGEKKGNHGKIAVFSLTCHCLILSRIPNV
jgi:hypothetical protein